MLELRFATLISIFWICFSVAGLWNKYCKIFWVFIRKWIYCVQNSVACLKERGDSLLGRFTPNNLGVKLCWIRIEKANSIQPVDRLQILQNAKLIKYQDMSDAVRILLCCTLNLFWQKSPQITSNKIKPWGFQIMVIRWLQHLKVEIHLISQLIVESFQSLEILCEWRWSYSSRHWSWAQKVWSSPV